MRKRYRATLKIANIIPADGTEFLYAEIEYRALNQGEAEYIAREYARYFDGATVDSVTEMAAL